MRETQKSAAEQAAQTTADARQKKVPVRAREKPAESGNTSTKKANGAKSTSGKKRESTASTAAARVKKQTGREDAEQLQMRSAQTIALRLPEIADSMAQAAIEGNTTAARVCLDILERQPKGADSGVVYVLTHVANGEQNGEAD